MAIDSAVALCEYPKIVSGSSAVKAPGFAVNSFSTARVTSLASVRLLSLLEQFGRRQYLQRRGTWVSPDHVADRRGGRAIVETQRVQIQILGVLRESLVRCRLDVPPRMIAVSLPDSGSSASPNANAAVSTDVSTHQPAAGARQQPESPPTKRVTTHCDPFNPARTDYSENIRIWQTVSFPCCGWPEFGERMRRHAGQR